MGKIIYTFKRDSRDEVDFEKLASLEPEVSPTDMMTIRNLFRQVDENNRYIPVSLAANWKPLKYAVYRYSRKCLPTDYPYAGYPYDMMPIFSRRAVNVLGDLLVKDGELLPLECAQGEFYAYNYMRIIDLLDMEKSRISWDISVDRTGQKMKPKRDNINDIWHFEIHEERLGDAAIFRLPYDHRREYVTEEFRNRAVEAGLQGMAFKQVWPQPSLNFKIPKRLRNKDPHEEQSKAQGRINQKGNCLTNRELFNSVKDEVLIKTIIDIITKSVVRNHHNNEYDKIKKLSEGMQYVWAIWWLESEVNNGGFNQYFYNSSGQFAEEAYNGCIAIGASHTAQIVNSAILTLFKEMDLYRKTKEAGTMEAFMDSYKGTKLRRYDDEFYKCKDDISGLLIKYIRNNPNMFVKE